MIVGQQPRGSPGLLIIFVALLAAAWVAREATHRNPSETKASSVGPGAARPPSVIVGAPPESQPRRP